MKTIEKKVLPEYFAAIVAGKKKFELRLNNFEVAEGDVLLLREWDPQAQEYTGRQIEKQVTDVQRFKIQELFWPVEEIMENGIQILSIE